MIKIYTSNSVIKFSNKLETKTEEYRNLEDIVKGDKKNINEEEGEYEVESILDHKTNGVCILVSTSSTKINTRANAGTVISTKRNAAKQESRHRKFPKKPKTIKVTLDNEYEILIIDDNWENKVESIESIVRDDKTKELFAYLKWY
ncbi:7956_t:CDS:2 [Entrophospora sp. SA101]|nr:7956_t:CDS:2 [Entrophospora sp. SA101]CAJ0843177.1 12986_t:CDS:2 [Entrophospora sp. SA101]